jgi:hypothetical protein
MERRNPRMDARVALGAASVQRLQHRFNPRWRV